jgi:methylated-DNA-[protein]-cysteine S-methyltransferase
MVEYGKNQMLLLQTLTSFEMKVLLECAKIPRGRVCTYAQVAAAIGKPHAARAVGNALAKNQLAPIIPCHRVIRSDGKIGNYSGKGGAAAKRKMLESEGAGILQHAKVGN